MRPGTELVTAAAAGAVVFLVALALLPETAQDPEIEDPDALPLLPARYQTPFDTVVETPATIVVLDPRGHLAAGEAGVAGGGLWGRTGRGTEAVRLVTVTKDGAAQCPGTGTPCGLGLTWTPASPNATRLLDGNHTVVRLAVYVFDDVGSLLATSTNDTRFGTPSILLPAAWHLGEGPAPRGAVRAASAGGGLLRDYIPLLDGLPEGGIASARIESHPYAGLTGPITVTARVDGIPAPSS